MLVDGFNQAINIESRGDIRSRYHNDFLSLNEEIKNLWSQASSSIENDVVDGFPQSPEMAQQLIHLTRIQACQAGNAGASQSIQSRSVTAVSAFCIGTW